MKYVYLNFDILNKDSNFVLLSSIKPLNGGMIENYTNGGMVRESPRLMIFRLFSMIFCKITLKIRFSTYF